MPYVSVIIPTFNRAHHISRAIDSVLAQDLHNFELIVVDDGSTDNTRELVEVYGDSLRYIVQGNQGPGAARNAGVNQATGEWIAFLDSDDVWLPNKLAQQVPWAQSIGADVCFHDVVRHDKELGVVRRSDDVRRRVPGLPALKSELLPDSFRLLVTAGSLFLTTSLLVKRAAFLAVGGMSRELLTNQDIELYLRLFPRYRVAFLAEPLAVYSPAENRAFEIASRKAHTAVERGESRVLLDRLRAYAKAFQDRMAHRDADSAMLTRQGILRTLRALAGLSRQNRRYLTAFRAYSLCLALQALPFADPTPLLGRRLFRA